MRHDNNTKIEKKIQSGLPDPTYIKFVSDYLISSTTPNLLQDPFQVDIPDKMQSSLYVTVENAEQLICIPGSKIIQGTVGSGKSTLIKMWHQQTPGQELIVTAEPRASLRPEKILTGEESLLTPQILLRAIFNSYWEYLICAEKKRILHLPRLRKDLEWMSTVRWFFQYDYTRPLRRHCIEDFEFRTWLQSFPSVELFTANDAFEDILRELVRFITVQDIDNPSGIFPTFNRILLMVDAVDSPKASKRLIEDADMLHDLHIDNIDFILFWPLLSEDSFLDAKVKEMGCVQRGEVPIHKMPVWSRAQLHGLLAQRITLYDPGNSPAANVLHEIIGAKIPEDYLKLSAKKQFTKILLDSLCDQIPLPLHALRLARAFVAACAGCMKEDYPLPITVENLEDIANQYWSAIKKTKEGKSI